MRGISLYTILLYRNFINFILNTIVCKVMGVSLYTENPAVQRLLYLRSAFGMVSVCLLFGSLMYVSLVDNTVLIQTSPLWSVLFGYLILHEKITRGNIISIFISFFGILLIIRPPFVTALFSGNENDEVIEEIAAEDAL
jgi:drug/metabolite transporter (DMT)-like permease